MSDSKSLLNGSKKESSSGKEPSERLLLSGESIDEEYEIDLIDEADQHKTPLIKETNAKNEKGSPFKKSKLTLDLNGKAARNEKSKKKTEIRNAKLDDDDDEEDEDASETTHFNHPNTPPPITIGKIKIFNPGRRRRAVRARHLIRKLFTLLFAAAFLMLILYSVDQLPDFVSTAFGWFDKSARQLASNRKDMNSKCDQVVSDIVWRANFPMLTIESSLRLVHVNNDSVLDVIVPFGTGIDASYYDQTLCQIYFNQTEPASKRVGCGGGVMAVDGSTGKPIWTQYTPHELFATNCNIDINLDGYKDCIIGGRMASLYALDGRKGTVLWAINSMSGDPISETSNFYTPLLIPKDVDGDSVSDIVVMHGGDPLRKAGDRVRNVARLMVISAKTGQILTWSYVPDNSESYYSPQLLVHPDGTLLVMFGTGGETHPGGLYVVALDALLSGQVERNCRVIFQDCCKGIITPPVLVDINGDEIVDIIMSHFNSTVFAFDGLTFEPIWKRQFPGGETYSSPSVGFFNGDNIPDFAVTYQFGPGFPIYYYAEFNVIDGRNGDLLLKKPIRMPIGTQSSPLTVTTFAQNDIFLFWYSSCSSSLTIQANNQSQEFSDNGPYQISPGSTVHDSSRADFCRLRFGDNIQHFTQYRAITFDSSISFYDSRKDEPFGNSQPNYTQLAYRWYLDKLGQITTSGTMDPATMADDNTFKMDNNFNNDDRGNAWGPVEQNILNLNGRSAIRDDNIVYNQGTYDQLKKYKKWSPPNTKVSSIMDVLFRNQQRPWNSNSQNQRRKRVLSGSRAKRHVGLHNGDQVQRVISTGTLAPALTKESSKDQLPVDGSIDIIFATYSFPPSSNVKLMSDEMRKCIQAYMTPEKETEMRLLDDTSLFKRLGYDHDAYEAAVKELCAKETEKSGSLQQPVAQEPEDTQLDPLKKNDWLKQMGSMTLHRVNLKCFDKRQNKQIGIKEYRYQWWPAYLGVLADAVANLIDEST